MKIPYKLNPFGKNDGPGIYGPTDGLVFYAPLEKDLKEYFGREMKTSGTGDITFQTRNNVPCMYIPAAKKLYTDEQKNIPIGDHDWTISLWCSDVNNDYTGATRMIFELGAKETNGAIYAIDYIKDAKVGIYGGNSWKYAGDFHMDWNNWIYQYTNNANKTLSIFLNGVLIKTLNAFNHSLVWDSFVISTNFDGGEQFTGYFTGVRIYDRILTADEKTELAQEFSPKYEINANDQTFDFGPVSDQAKTISYTSIGTVTNFEIVSGALPSSITLNSSNGKFVGKALTDADHTYNLVVRMSGNTVVTKDINVTITTRMYSILTIPSPQNITFTTEKQEVYIIQMTSEGSQSIYSELYSGSLPTGISFNQVQTETIISNGQQSSAEQGTFQLAFTAPNHPTPVIVTFNVQVNLNQITCIDQTLDFYSDLLSLPVKYSSQNPITPVYSLSGTLPTGISFDSSTGIFTYDGVSTPTSGEVNVTVSSSTGNSTPSTGKFSLISHSGVNPIPSGAYWYIPCSDATTIEGQTSSSLQFNSSTTFYTKQQVGRDSASFTNENGSLRIVCDVMPLSGNSSRSLAFWIKFPDDAVFTTNRNGQSIISYGNSGNRAGWRIGVAGTSKSNAKIGFDCYNGYDVSEQIVGDISTKGQIAVPNDSNWHIYAQTWDANSKLLKHFLDGVILDESVVSTTFVTQASRKPSIGQCQFEYNWSGWPGNPNYYLSDVRFWTRALTDTEVANMINS